MKNYSVAIGDGFSGEIIFVDALTEEEASQLANSEIQVLGKTDTWWIINIKLT